MTERTAALGDVLRRIAMYVQTDLQNTLMLMRGQDPELRTTELQQFLHRSRKRMLQVYALTRWLSSPGISQSFRAIADFNGQLATVEQDLARNLDEMFFSHAGMFAMRSRVYEVPSAVELLARSSYDDLPTSVFSCGKPDFPALLGKDEVERELTIRLRVRLASSGVSAKYADLIAAVNEGVLTLELSRRFRLYLTLASLQEAATWKVLNVHLLLFNDSTMGEKERQIISTAEKTLLAAVRTCIEGRISAEDGNDSELSQMLDVCEDGAVDCGAAILAAQLEHIHRTETSFCGISKVALVDEKGISCLSLKLWESSFHREPQYELRLHRRADVGAIDNASSLGRITTSLRTKLTFRSPTMVLPSGVSDFPIPAVNEVLGGEHYLQDASSEVAATRLLYDALALLSLCRLLVLLTRLNATLEQLPSDLTADVMVELRRTDVGIFHSSSGTSIRVTVDARTGKFVVDTSELRQLSGASKRTLDLFATEINNQDSESYCSDYLLKHGVPTKSSAVSVAEDRSNQENQFATLPLQPLLITTLDEVLRIFPLVVLATCTTAALGEEVMSLSDLAPVLLPACSLNPRGQVHNLQFWADTSTSRSDSQAAFAAIYPNAYSSLDATALTARATAVTLPARRSAAKKRGFSEAALESAIPGGFVSAGDLAAAESVAEVARYPSVPIERSVLALYLLLALDEDGRTVRTAACLCRVVRRVVDGVMQAPAPTIIHQRDLGHIALGDQAQCSAFLSKIVKDSKAWAAELVHTANTTTVLGFTAQTELLLMYGVGVVSVCGADSADAPLHVLLHQSNTTPTGWKQVPNSLPGHLNSASSASAVPAGSVRLALSVHAHQAKENDYWNLACEGLGALNAEGDSSDANGVDVFVWRLVESVISSWPIPHTVTNVKTETLKHLRFALTLAMLVRAVCNLQCADASAFRCAHFDVRPAPTQAKSCECAATILLALEDHNSPPNSNGTASNGHANSSSKFRMLTMEAKYTCSTMKGQGRSVNVADMCEVALRDLLSGGFSEERTAQELLQDDGVELKQLLERFATAPAGETKG